MLSRLLVICGFLATAGSASANTTPVTASGKNIVQLAQSVPDLSTLVTALVAGDLTGALSGTGPFTVFAPTNEAFAKIPAATLAHLLDPANIKELDAVLEYHVISGAAVYSKDLKPFQMVKTLEGDELKIVKAGRVVVNNATVTAADNAATNGVVHIIDGVLIPPAGPAPATKNIVQLAQSVADLSTLVTALVAGNLTTALSGTGPFTVFAPTNEAFLKIPAATLAHLFDPANIKELDALLEYHVIAGAAVYSKDLKPFQMVKTLEGDELTIVKAGRVVVNNATVTAADNTATNGVVHIIDGVLIPPAGPAPTPAPATKNIVQLAQSVADLSTLVTALVAGNLTTALSGTGPFTVFAPTNEAFLKIPAATLAHLLDPANIKELDAVLEYHVIAGAAIYSKDLKPDQKAKTLEGDSLDITASSRSGVQINGVAKVTAADNAATNGVVHIIDAVLIPPTAPTPSPPPPAPGPATKNIVQLAESVPDLSTLVSALVAGKLVAALAFPGPFTVFAPTNEAFNKIPAATLAHLLDPANLKELDAVLEYHVISGAAIYSKDLKPDQKAKTLEGDSLDITASSRSGVQINGVAKVTIADNAATNGVVHIIDAVLIPPTPGPSPGPASKNIVQLAQSVPDLSTLVTALVAGNLTTALSGTGPFTVFAPTNEAFAKIPADTLRKLLEPKNIKELDAVLEYHVIAGAAVHAKDLKPYQQVKTLEGSEVSIEKSSKGVEVNHFAHVTTADVDATNGVVHIIDGVLIPRKGTVA